MKLSVIVVNWNVAGLLRSCLQSLLQQTAPPPDGWEILVVDNCSSDESVPMLRAEFPQVRLIENQQNRGFGRANNQAFAACTGEYVLLLNPDTVVQDRAVSRLLERMETMPDCGALGCQLLNSDGSFQRWTGGSIPTLGSIASHYLLLHRFLPRWMLPSPLYLEHQPEHDLEVGWASGACLLLRREALGGQLFDERFFLYGEDLDLCRRIGAGKRWKVIYTPQVSIVHHEGRSLIGSPPELQDSKLNGLRMAFASGRGRLSLLAYDALALTGFVLRYTIQCLAAFLPGRNDPARRAMLARYVQTSLQFLVGRGRTS